jgi:predicted RNase H-like HicB family nuclease
MKYVVIIEKSKSGFGAYAPDLPGVGVVGDSPDEVRQLIREAISLHLEGLREDGEPIPEPSVEIDYIDAPAA